MFAVSTSCAVSRQQEQQMGADYSTRIAQELPLLTAPQVVRYITELGNSLAKVTDTQGLTWHFTVVDSREVNAFAVPGGWVYVNRGLIEKAQNMSELAGVLGHEIAHVTLRHSVEQMQQAQGANVSLLVPSTLTSVCESGTGQAAIGVGGSALFAEFSRTDKQEADAEAVKITINAGISPNGIPEMFQILLNERQADPNIVDAFFATHPLEEDRITSTEALSNAYPPSQLRGLVKDTPAFERFRQRLLALPPSPAPKQS
jgi:predicted Zn-dependent protease